MDAANTRDWLSDKLTPILPQKWRIITTEKDLGLIDTTAVMVSHKSIEREPTAPQSQHRLTFTISLVWPLINADEAEGPLGHGTDLLLYRLDELTGEYGNLQWTKADKVLFQNKYLAFEVDVVVITEKSTIITESE